MAVTRLEPHEAFAPWRETINQLCEEGLLSPLRHGVLGRYFPVDVYETEHAFMVEAVLPGVMPEDVRVSAIRDTLTIHATIKPAPKPEKLGTYLQRERYTGEMTRTVQLPTAIEPDKVSATYQHGVLTLQVPKAAAEQPATIPIKVTEAPIAH
ncbi:MAG TPA: Hsp20/alpha crystallin family protein [Ktedonobacterales bacterium]|nr:Hsp20/alpha crystallin family protein [Ktedonobacterales bacterium]